VDKLAIAKAAKKNPDAVTSKLPAISAKIEDGSTPKQIIECGERWALQSKAKKRAASADGLVSMNFRVVPNVREGILSDFERPRIAMG